MKITIEYLTPVTKTFEVPEELLELANIYLKYENGEELTLEEENMMFVTGEENLAVEVLRHYLKSGEWYVTEDDILNEVVEIIP